MATPELREIVAVVTCGPRRANGYLQHGYALLATGEWSQEEERAPQPDGVARTYVRRGVTFVLGRTADVPAYNPDEEPEATS